MVSILFMLMLLFFVSIIVGFVAFSAVRRIESTLKPFPLNELTFRIYQLEQKVAELQKKLAAAPPATQAQSPIEHAAPPPAPVAGPPEPQQTHIAQPTAPAMPPPQPPSPPRPPLPPAPVLSRPTKEPSASDLEALIGGRWFNRIGIIALLFAVSYFLKLAFDNNWIGPAGRVTIGILLGLAMLPWSDWLLSRDYTYFSEGIAGLGEATLFVSVWAGCQYYMLFSRQVGFIALVAVTAVMAYLALRRSSERIAFISLLGGLLTPALMSSGKNEQVVLFSYLLLLGAAALFVSWRKDWQSLLPLAFVGTHLYFWQWYDLFYNRFKFLGSTLFFATLIFLLYAVIPAARALLRLSLRALDILLVLANAFAYITILYTLLWANYRWPLALLFVALAIAHEAIALLLPDREADEAAAPRALYTGLAVACFTLAIPTKLEHNNITYAFAIEGAALVCIGFRTLANLLRPFGYFMLTMAAGHLLIDPPLAGTFLFNERFFTYLIYVAGLSACLWFAASAINELRPTPLVSPSGVALPSRSFDSTRAEAALLSIAINFFSLLALTLEFWDYFGGGPRTHSNSLAQSLSISILWAAYAGLLMLLGMQRQWPLLRWQALFLLGIVVMKVFFYDLSFLDRAYRILSFFILGAVLLVISFFYQRKLTRDRFSP
jgi:uncharacterized membrane protein